MEYLEEVREKLLMVCLVQFQSVCHSEGCETSGNGKLIWFAKGYYIRRRLSSVSVMAFGHRLPSRMSQVGGEGAALASQRDCPQSLFDSYLKLDWLQSEREGVEQRGGNCQTREERCLDGGDNWT